MTNEDLAITELDVAVQMAANRISAELDISVLRAKRELAWYLASRHRMTAMVEILRDHLCEMARTPKVNPTHEDRRPGPRTEPLKLIFL